MKDITIFDFCTSDHQRAVYTAYLNNGKNKSAAARELGLAESTVREHIKKINKRAAAKGFAPDYDMDKVVPDPFYIKGTSTLYGKDGNVKMQWVKSNIDLDEFAEQIKEAVQEFYDHKPVLIDYNNLDHLNDDLETDIIPWIQIGDAHFGMLAHSWETGNNFDLKIAEQELCHAIGMLLADLPNVERLVINDLGDFTHYENMAGTTDASGHLLDKDGRFPKMIKVYSRTMRTIVDMALQKAKYVDVIINQGNHSRTNDFWMQELLECHYSTTNRVNVLNNASVFIPYRMGNTFVMTHHSDKCKPNRLANVMATDFAKDWGESKFRYIDIGHIHHNMVLKEHPGVVVESFNILAPLDKYAHDGGWRNRSSVSAILRSKTYGEVGRILLPIQKVQDDMTAKYGWKVREDKRSYTV